MNYNYPKEIYNTKIENLNLKIIGVDHRLPVLKRNEEFFREEINSPDYIFFEGGLRKNLFYQGLAKLLDKKDKFIYVPDPLFKGLGVNDLILGGVGADIFVSSLKKPISRMDFLKKSCMGLIGLYLITGIWGFRENVLQKILGKNATFDNKIAYDAVQDFRNIVSADNLNRAANELNFEGDATYFVGYSHLNGLRAYINNPNMRKEKRKLYPHLERPSLTDKIREYKNKEGVWEIVRGI
jgi:hypothetical protein